MSDDQDRPPLWRVVGLAIPRGVPSRLPLRGRDGHDRIGLPVVLRSGALADTECPLSYDHDDAQELRGEGALRVRCVERPDGWWIASEALPDDGEGPFLWRLLRPRLNSLVVGLSPALVMPDGGWSEVKADGARVAEVSRAELVAVSLVLKPKQPCFAGTFVTLVAAT